MLGECFLGIGIFVLGFLGETIVLLSNNKLRATCPYTSFAFLKDDANDDIDQGYFEKIEELPPWHVVFPDQAKSDARTILLVPFSTVTDIVSDPREQEAFLTHLSCNTAVAKYGPLCLSMLKGNSND